MRDMGRDDNSIHRAIRAHLAFCNSFRSTGDGGPHGSQVEGEGGSVDVSALVLHMYPVSGAKGGDEDQRQMCVMGHPQQGEIDPLWTCH